MRGRFKRQPTARDRRPTRHTTDEERELGLLAEFLGHGSVASLAGAIARRIGGRARAADLIVRAGLGRTTGAEEGAA